MLILSGILFHLLGGFASGSFYLPYKKVKGWAWESYWIVGGLFSWLIVPFVAAWLTVPDFLDIIAAAPFKTLAQTYLMGLLWGIGGLTFGLAMRYLGLSLGMAVALGFTSAFGALIPPIYRDVRGLEGATFTQMLAGTGGLLILGGVVLCLAGIVICGIAGSRKEKELNDEEKKISVKEFNLKKGLTVAIVSGILSACFNYGIDAGKDLAMAAQESGANPLFRNNVVFVVILWGGLTTNLVWCIVLNARNRTFPDYSNRKTPLVNNYLLSALAGTIWFLQFFFYGMGETRLGNDASSWILHMAFIILVSTMWGLYLKEWKGVSGRTKRIIAAGIFVIILSVVLVGYGNALK